MSIAPPESRVRRTYPATVTAAKPRYLLALAPSRALLIWFTVFVFFGAFLTSTSAEFYKEFCLPSRGMGSGFEDGRSCSAFQRQLTWHSGSFPPVAQARDVIVANWPPIYIGKESDKHWEEGDDPSLLDPKTIQYKRKGNAFATDEQLARIAKVPKREFMRRGINQHTLEKICRRKPVRMIKLAECLKVLEAWEPQQHSEL